LRVVFFSVVLFFSLCFSALFLLLHAFISYSLSLVFITLSLLS
jgi:hypothetical protein